MKKNYLLLFVLLLCKPLFSQQYVWTQKTAPPVASGTYDAASFSINGKIYMAGGCNSTLISTYNTTWAYDPITDSWAQKANMPGNGTYGSASFVISDEGYVVTGWGRSGGSPYATNFNYKYNPNINSWIAIAAFPDNNRYTGCAFTINGKGYFGLGYSPLTDDLLEYDPINDSWTQKASCAGGVRQAGLGFAIGNYGYFGFGGQYSTELNDLWKYDAVNNAWQPTTSFPSSGRSANSVFILNNEAFVINGSDYYTTPFQDVYKFNPVNATWSYVNQFPGGPRFCMSEGQANNKGYCGQGCYQTQNTGNYATTNDWWELSLTTGMDENENDISLSVYPNPASENVSINFSSAEPGLNYDLKIFDIKGALFLERSNVKENSLKFNISSFAAGEYILQIQSEKSVISRAFIKK